MTGKLELLFGAALAALAGPVLAADTATPAAAVGGAAEAGSFTPPAGPQLLTRELRKVLGDGKEVVVVRRYAISFHPAGDGFRVAGRQIGCDVDAPADLAAFAEIERQRDDSGLFPLTLDPRGTIVAEAGGGQSETGAAVRAAAAAYYARTDLSEAERNAALAMVAKLQAAARDAGHGWPADLFRPTRGERRESRELPLPDGSTGSIGVTITADHGASGVLARLERRVVTTLGGSDRVSVETYTLAALPAALALGLDQR